MAEVKECIMCIQPIEYFGLGPCNHRDVCAKCTLRMTELYGGTSCPLCKMEYGKVVVTSDPTGTYQEAMQSPFFSASAKRPNVLFDTPQTEKLFLRMFELHCMASSKCPRTMHGTSSPFKNASSLKNHLSQKHGKYLCTVCMDSGKMFVCDLEVFPSKNRLRQHQARHPLCEFCNVRFVDDDALMAHLHDRHEICNLCDEANQFFNTRDDLAAHYQDDHYPCPLRCNGGLSAFRSPEGLKSHMLQDHGDQMTRAQRAQYRQLNLSDFNFRADPPPGVSGTRSFGAGQGSFRGNQAGSSRQVVRQEEFPTLAAARSSTADTGSAGRSTGRSSRGAPQSSSSTSSSQPARAAEPPPEPVRVRLEPGRQVSEDTYKERSRVMIARIKAALGNDPAQFSLFKNISKMYRASEIPIAEYYTAFIQLFGAARANAIIPDLIATLPNAEKREELADFHRNAVDTLRKEGEGGASGSGRQSGSARGRGRRRDAPPPSSGPKVVRLTSKRNRRGRGRGSSKSYRR